MSFSASEKAHRLGVRDVPLATLPLKIFVVIIALDTVFVIDLCSRRLSSEEGFCDKSVDCGVSHDPLLA